jgi:hypothetical protein
MDGCVTEQGFWGDADVDGELEFAFGAEDAGWDLRAWRCFAAVVGHLPVEEPDTVWSFEGY